MHGLTGLKDQEKAKTMLRQFFTLYGLYNYLQVSHVGTVIEIQS